MQVFPFQDPASLARPRTLRENLGEGSFLLRHPQPLQPYALHRRLAGTLGKHHAGCAVPGGTRRDPRLASHELFAGARDGRTHRASLDRLEAARRQAGGHAVGQLSRRGAAGAGHHAHRAICTVSSAYCRLTKDFSKIGAILDALDPALVYASDAGVYGPAVGAWKGKAPVVFGTGASAGSLAFSLLCEPTETAAVMQAFAAIRPDDHAKYLLTSGSTGELTAKSFDEDGFYLIGDAGKLVDPGDPAQGVAFDGRVAEDFKLMSGTWVNVGMLRTRVVTAMAPHVADVVITGHDRDEIGLLVFPTVPAKSLPPGQLRAHVQSALHALAAEDAGSAQTPTRAIILDEPPSPDAGEITDKGYINQRAVLTRRNGQVEALYSDDDPNVIR